MEAVAFFHEPGDLEDLGADMVHVNHPLDPVHVLFEAVGLKEGVVVRIIVQAGEGAQAVVAFHQGAFLVHVREAQRALQLGAAVLLAPCDDGVQEGVQDFLVFDEIEPSETHHGLFPELVGLEIDYGRHASHDLVVAVGEVQACVAEFICAVLLGIEGIVFVSHQRGDPVFAVLIKFKRECEEFTELPPVLDCYDLYRHDI